jgi:hypothetical protein
LERAVKTKDQEVAGTVGEMEVVLVAIVVVEAVAVVVVGEGVIRMKKYSSFLFRYSPLHY